MWTAIASPPGPVDYLTNLNSAYFNASAQLTDAGYDYFKVYEYRIYGSAINADQLDALYTEMRNRYGL